MKVCRNCQELREDTEFYKDPRNKDGLVSYCKRCLSIKEKLYGFQKKRHRTLKEEVLTHYADGLLGCVLCEFKDIRALSIDHINGGGRRHVNNLNKIITSTSLYRWLKNNNYPEGYQTLCMNCQFIKRDDEVIRVYELSDGQKKAIINKDKTIAHYSEGKNCCNICGYVKRPALVFDHIDGGGTKHHKLHRYGSLAKWLHSNNYPSGYQVLCQNCNFIKYFESKE